MAPTTKPKIDADLIAAEGAATGPAEPTAARSPRPATKLSQVLILLQREAGATIPELAEATGWQAHTVRGALSGMIAKKLAHSVTSEKIDGRGRVYRIVPKTA